jgi:CheY-like chemotaxis protein
MGPTVLIVGAEDISLRLASTVLGRQGVTRAHVAETGQARDAVCRLQPRLVLVDGRETAATRLLQDLRADDATRRVSLVAVVDHPSLEGEQRLRDAGANIVLAGEPIPFLWDQWLEELLSVPPRRAARFPVRLEVWQRRLGHTGPRLGWTVNLSTRGLLLETVEGLEIGATLDIQFRLPHDEQALQAVGQVVRIARQHESGHDSGVKFLRLDEIDRGRIDAFVGREH